MTEAWTGVVKPFPERCDDEFCAVCGRCPSCYCAGTHAEQPQPPEDNLCSWAQLVHDHSPLPNGETEPYTRFKATGLVRVSFDDQMSEWIDKAALPGEVRLTEMYIDYRRATGKPVPAWAKSRLQHLSQNPCGDVKTLTEVTG